MKKNLDFIIIGAGLAGTEAALVLANHGARVGVYEQKPQRYSPAHKLSGAAELVCSNSFKSTRTSSAHGLLKEELKFLGSPLLKLAYQSAVPGGQSLSVDREKLSKLATEALQDHPQIDFHQEACDELSSSQKPTLVATGPLTSSELMNSICKLLGDEGLYFYDATSPVVSLDSLEMEYFFWGSRRADDHDYLNLPLNKEQYLEFYENLLKAEKSEAHLEEEKLCFFEGCLPIEEIARRGRDTLRYSCMKPVGLQNENFHKPYAVIQFRREKAAGELLNMVGFQTRMKWPEQERVFRQLPGMSEAKFMRLGAMHRNSFINSPLHLNERLQLKKAPSIFMAGQITGGEGYTEALSTGHYAALQMMDYPQLPSSCGVQSLIHYLIHSDPRHFQPMNFNFGLLPSLSPSEVTMKGRKKLPRAEKQNRLAQRSLEELRRWQNDHFNTLSMNA